MPTRLQISLVLSFPSSPRRLASSICPSLMLFFLPPLRPLALAVASPASVRSRMMSRSSSAIDAVIRKKNLRYRLSTIDGDFVAQWSCVAIEQALLDGAYSIIRNQQLSTDSIEFEMLKGVTPERLATLQEYGCATRVYLPYGKEWYLYLCNRLTEHPPNLYQAIADAVARTVPSHDVLSRSYLSL